MTGEGQTDPGARGTGWKRFLLLGFENPLLRGGLFLLFTLLVIRLSFVEPEGHLPEVGKVAPTYYVAPRAVSCEKPVPNHQALVLKARGDVSPIYEVDNTWLEARLKQLREAEDALSADVNALLALDSQIREIASRQSSQSARIKESPYIQNGKDKQGEAASRVKARELEALQQKSSDLAAHAARVLVGVAPAVTPQEADAVVNALRKSEPLVGDAFQASAMCLDELRRWLVVETSDLTFQKDRSQGIVLAHTRAKLAPDARVMTYLEALDQMRGRVVSRIIGENFPRLKGNRQLVPLVEHLVVTSIQVNLRKDETRTQKALAEAEGRVPKTRTIEFAQGQTILAMGDIVEDWQRGCIQRLSARALVKSGMGDVLGIPVPTVLLLLGISLLSVFASLALVGFARKVFHDRLLSGGDYLALGVVLVLHLVLLRVFLAVGDVLAVQYPDISRGVTFSAAPVALAVMLVNSLMGGGVALLALLFLVVTTAAVAVMSGSEVLSGNFPTYYILYMLTVCSVGIWMTRRITRRGAYFLAAMVSGASGMICWAVVFLIERGQVPANHAFQLGLSSLVAGAVNYFLLVALTPMFEYLWDYTTDSRLVELASTDHPALKELSRRAPGTYQHSLWLASLAEEAAGRIGANPLLAKVGAYYHDLGKLVATSETGLQGGSVDSPIYFAENQLMGSNPHDHLSPEISARILRKHVEQSVRMIRKYRLGRRIMDIAAQHHGTTIMEHFYSRARTLAEKNGTTVRVDDFRYPGPRPQSKEAALVMLADSVEAFVRALAVHTEERITERVREMLNRRMVDGQLDDCALTFKELKVIEESFVKSLQTMYHARPEYQRARPEEQTVRLKREDVQDILEEQKTVQLPRATVPAPAKEPDSGPSDA